MSDFTRFNPAGAKSISFQHPRFGPIQREYNIPMQYRSPKYFFKEVEWNTGALFMWRVCSVWEFYDLLCKDTPGYRRKPKYGDQKSGTISADIPKGTTIRDNGKTPVGNRLQVASSAAEISKPVVSTIIKTSSGQLALAAEIHPNSRCCRERRLTKLKGTQWGSPEMHPYQRREIPRMILRMSSCMMISCCQSKGFAWRSCKQTSKGSSNKIIHHITLKPRTKRLGKQRRTDYVGKQDQLISKESLFRETLDVDKPQCSMIITRLIN